MTVNLIHTTLAADGTQMNTRAARDWASISAIAPNHGMIFIDEDTVNRIAMLLDGQELSNGETVKAYAYEDDEPYAALVCSFGPALLPVQVQDYVRDRLAASENGKGAARLFDEVIRLGLQISLQGKEHCDAHIKAVNWVADDVEINRCKSNMIDMYGALGLGSFVKEGLGFDCPLEVFEKAVNDNAGFTGMGERLQKFVACAKRAGSTHVYFA